jgi:hypothetical protein
MPPLRAKLLEKMLGLLLSELLSCAVVDICSKTSGPTPSAPLSVGGACCAPPCCACRRGRCARAPASSL